MKVYVIGLLSTFRAIGVSAGGFIQCLDGSVNGGRGNIPAHNTIYSFDGGQTLFCDALLEACGEIEG